jgi:hypothetical protein
MMRLLFTISLLCSLAQAQQINGYWTGTLTQEPGGCFPVYHLELQIEESNQLIKGNSYDYYDTTKYVRLFFTGRFNSTTNRIVITENEVVVFKIPKDCIPCIKTYDLTYQKTAEGEFLTGTWKGFEMNAVARNCPPGKITLTKSNQSAFPLSSLPKTVSTSPPIQLEPRAKDLVQKIQLSVPSIQIDLYDNAEIDNDTVTVLVNNEVLLRKQRLSNKPHTLHFTALEGVVYEFMMYADNLGEIPPNTALMVITAGDKKYEVRLASSKEKNAVVQFQYNPPR